MEKILNSLNTFSHKNDSIGFNETIAQQNNTKKPNLQIDAATGVLYDATPFVESYSNAKPYIDPVTGQKVTSLNYNALPNSGKTTKVFDQMCACYYEEDIKIPKE